MLRHTLVTTMLDAGVSLGDVLIAARRADPRTPMRHDRARKNLDERTAGRSHSWGPSPVRAKGSRLRYRTGLPSDSAYAISRRVDSPT